MSEKYLIVLGSVVDDTPSIYDSIKYCVILNTDNTVEHPLPPSHTDTSLSLPHTATPLPPHIDASLSITSTCLQTCLLLKQRRKSM